MSYSKSLYDLDKGSGVRIFTNKGMMNRPTWRMACLWANKLATLNETMGPPHEIDSISLYGSGLLLCNFA